MEKVFELYALARETWGGGQKIPPGSMVRCLLMVVALENEQGIWQDLVKAKYLNKVTLYTHKPTNS